MTRTKSSTALTQVRRIGYRILAVLIALGIWHLFAIGPGDASGFPSPIETIKAGADLVVESVFWTNILTSIQTALMGLGLSILIGLPIGLLIGSNEYVKRSTQLVLDFFRTVPAIALLPLFLVLFGASRELGLMLIVVSAVWPIIIQTSYAVGEISPGLRRVGKAYHLTAWYRLRYIVAPSMFPFVFAGLRIASTISLLMAISSEYLGGTDGLGYVLLQATQLNNSADALVYSFTAAMLGLTLNFLFVLLQRRVLWWHTSVRKGGAE